LRIRTPPRFLRRSYGLWKILALVLNTGREASSLLTVVKNIMEYSIMPRIIEWQQLGLLSPIVMTVFFYLFVSSTRKRQPPRQWPSGASSTQKYIHKKNYKTACCSHDGNRFGIVCGFQNHAHLYCPALYPYWRT
jgi:hypothetical protein